MEKISLLICDEDSAYVHALSEYLYGRKKLITVSVYTQVDSFLNGFGHFNLALLGKTFMESYESQHPDYEIDQMLYLSENKNESFMSYESFFKFQSMSGLNDIISKLRYETTDDGDTLDHPKITGIFSPIFHDLRLPFSLILTHIMAEKKKVLFLDLEAFSLLPEAGNNENGAKSFTDVIYLMESQGAEFRLEEHVFFYEDIAMLPPVKTPKDLWPVSSTNWEQLIMSVQRKGYSLVCLFDQFVPGEEVLLGHIGEMILLGCAGDEENAIMSSCEDFFAREEIKTRRVDLNMSKGHSGIGTYRFSSLLEGKLGRFVRNEFEGTTAISDYEQDGLHP